MGLVEYLAGNRQQIREAFAGQLLARVAGPAEKGAVRTCDAAIPVGEHITAWRQFEEIAGIGPAKVAEM